MLAMDFVTINARDYIDETKPVIDGAACVGASAAAELRAGHPVIVSIDGLRGVSSSFFNVILSAVAEVLKNDFSDGRFEIRTDSKVQRLVLDRSLAAFSKLR